MGDVNSRIHIFTVTVLGSGRVTNLHSADAREAPSHLNHLVHVCLKYFMGNSPGELSEELVP